MELYGSCCCCEQFVNIFLLVVFLLEFKKYMDEEFKKYGIYMVSCFGFEDIKGENNWVDIEDDDEDWIFEVIVWVDGMKIIILYVDDYYVMLVFVFVFQVV